MSTSHDLGEGGENVESMLEWMNTIQVMNEMKWTKWNEMNEMSEITYLYLHVYISVQMSMTVTSRHVTSRHCQCHCQAATQCSGSVSVSGSVSQSLTHVMIRVRLIHTRCLICSTHDAHSQCHTHSLTHWLTQSTDWLTDCDWLTVTDSLTPKITDFPPQIEWMSPLWPLFVHDGACMYSTVSLCCLYVYVVFLFLLPFVCLSVSTATWQHRREGGWMPFLVTLTRVT